MIRKALFKNADESKEHIKYHQTPHSNTIKGETL